MHGYTRGLKGKVGNTKLGYVILYYNYTLPYAILCYVLKLEQKNNASDLRF